MRVFIEESPKRFDIHIDQQPGDDAIQPKIMAALQVVLQKHEHKSGGRFMMATNAEPLKGYDRVLSIIDTSQGIDPPRILAKLHRMLYLRARAIGANVESPRPPPPRATDDLSDEGE